MTTKISFNKPLITAETPACCSAGLSIQLNISNLVPFKQYILDYSSIGPGVVQFADSSIEFTASNDLKTMPNIVYLEGAINYVIKAKISRVEESGSLTALSEDILGIDCLQLPPVRPTPTVTSTVSQTPSITPTITTSVTSTVSSTPSNTPTISVTPSITPTISITPSITPTLSVTPTNTATPSPTASVTPTLTASITPTRTLSATPTVTPTLSETPTCTPTNTNTPSNTPSPTPTTSVTPTMGMPKIYLTLGSTETCGSNELILYADIRNLLPNTTYKYTLNTTNDFDCYPSSGQFTTTTNSSFVAKNFLIYNKKYNTKQSCNVKNYGMTFLLYYSDDRLIDRAITNIVCDNSECDCPKFTVSSQPIVPTMPLNRVTPTPTRTPRPVTAVPELNEIDRYPKFLCPNIITKSKIGDGNIFIIDTLTDFSYEIRLNYSFFGSPERLKVDAFIQDSEENPCDPCGRDPVAVTTTYKTLYDSGYVGSVERYPSTNSLTGGILSGSLTTNGPYVFCDGLPRRQHQFGTYDEVVFDKPKNARYLICSVLSGCDQSSEWRASFDCVIRSTPTPTRTSTPTPSPTPTNTPTASPSPTPTPTVTPTATAAVCSYRFDNFDSDRGISENCSEIQDVNSSNYISVDKPINVISIGKSLIIAGSSACNDASYILPSRKIALTKIKEDSLDTSFGLSGKIIHAAKNDAGMNTNIDAKKIIPQTNKFLIISESDTQTVISRHLVSNGFLDVSFGLGGFVYIQAPENYRVLDFGDAVVTNNRLLISLNTYDTVNRKYMISVCSLNTNTGLINPTFGLKGFYHIDAGLNGSKYSMQKINIVESKPVIIAQNKDQEGLSTIVAIRLTAAGDIDKTFYDSGILKITAADIVGTSEDIPELSNALINNDGLYFSIVYKNTNKYEIFKYGYSGGKSTSWKNTITFAPATDTIIDTKYDASIYDAKTNSWYIAYNVLNEEYKDNTNKDLITRSGSVSIKGSASRYTRMPSEKYLECNDILHKQVLYNIGDNISVEFIQKSYKFVLAKHDLVTNTTQIIGNYNQLTKDNLDSNLVSSMIISGESLYLIGFGGDSSYNYSFLITKWNNFNTTDSTFGKNGYMDVNFDPLCTNDEDDTPPLVENPCPIDVTPMPTPGVSGPKLTISSVQFLCVSNKPTLKADISISNSTTEEKQYLLRIRKDQSTLSVSDITIPASATSYSASVDLSTIDNSNNNQICQVELLDVLNGLSVVASRITSLAKPTCV